MTHNLESKVTKGLVSSEQQLVSVEEQKSVVRKKAEWTVLVFIEARNNLSPFAIENINDMAAVGSSDKVNILIQWYQPYEHAWRYRVEKQKVVSLGAVENTARDCAGELVDFMRFAVSTHPAEHYCYILWDHGLGVTDPVWRPGHGMWGVGTSAVVQSSEPLATQAGTVADPDNPRTQIAGVTVPHKSFGRCKNHRGILFNEIDKTYLTNTDMVRAFSEIKNTVLQGKKIDIVGMDACLMAMLEIGYQIRDCVKYFVGSEEVILAEGWPYESFMHALTSLDMSPHQVAQSAVLVYERYYKERTELYTQSAVDLSYMEPIKQSLDAVVMRLKACKEHDKDLTYEIIAKARRRCQQFSTPTFVDLHSLYSELYRQLEYHGIEKFFKKKQEESAGYTSAESIIRKDIEQLKNTLVQGMNLVKSSVLANVAGSYLSRSQGISLYFPCTRIDSSYQKTDFARDSLWLGFLKELHAHR